MNDFAKVAKDKLQFDHLKRKVKRLFLLGGDLIQIDEAIFSHKTYKKKSWRR